jgi:hypothetical protein
VDLLLLRLGGRRWLVGLLAPAEPPPAALLSGARGRLSCGLGARLSCGLGVRLSCGLGARLNAGLGPRLGAGLNTRLLDRRPRAPRVRLGGPGTATVRPGEVRPAFPRLRRDTRRLPTTLVNPRNPLVRPFAGAPAAPFVDAGHPLVRPAALLARPPPAPLVDPGDPLIRGRRGRRGRRRPRNRGIRPRTGTATPPLVDPRDLLLRASAPAIIPGILGTALRAYLRSAGRLAPPVRVHG